jgi:hypothetical protein
MTKPVVGEVGDAGTPPDDVPASRLKVPAETVARISWHGLSPESSTTTGDWSRPAILLDRFVNLLASAHRVPRFLIMWESGHGIAAATSPESGRILTKWFLQADSMLERGQLSELDKLIARLERAGAFLFALANVLDCHLRDVHARRGDVLAAHGAILCSWLVASPIEHVAEISERWHQALIDDHDQQREVSMTAAEDLPDHMQVRGGELAWRLVQTHRLGKEFRQAYTRFSGTPT